MSQLYQAPERVTGLDVVFSSFIAVAFFAVTLGLGVCPTPRWIVAIWCGITGCAAYSAIDSYYAYLVALSKEQR